MEITDKNIDGGKSFDWGRISKEYGKFRDIYPQEFYNKIVKRNLCVDGQKILDLGTGTGVLPRNMYQYAGEYIHPIEIPSCYEQKFDLVYHEEYPVYVHFTRDSWNGRMKACRGIGASLTQGEIEKWEKEHQKLLRTVAPEEFDVLHYGAIAELRKI